MLLKSTAAVSGVPAAAIGDSNYLQAFAANFAGRLIDSNLPGTNLAQISSKELQQVASVADKAINIFISSTPALIGKGNSQDALLRYAGLATQLAAQQAANAVSNVVQANAAKTTAQVEFAKRMDAINERLATERTVFAKSAADVNLTPNLGGTDIPKVPPLVDNQTMTATWNPKMPVVGYNAGDVNDRVNNMTVEQETDYWERPNRQADREAFADLLENVDKYVFAHVRSFKDTVLGFYEKSSAVYNRECERLGVQPNLTNPVYAAPMFAKAAMSLIPDTLGEVAFVGVAGAATKPLLFAGAAASKTLLFTGNKAFNYGAKTLGYTGTTSGTKLVYSAVADGVAGASSKLPGNSKIFAYSEAEIAQGTANFAQAEKMRINLELQQIFTKDGKLTEVGIKSAKSIMRVGNFHPEAPVRKILSERGYIKDWHKCTIPMETKFYVPGRQEIFSGEVHVYKNMVTNEIYYDLDYKFKIPELDVYVNVGEFLNGISYTWRPKP